MQRQRYSLACCFPVYILINPSGWIVTRVDLPPQRWAAGPGVRSRSIHTGEAGGEALAPHPRSLGALSGVVIGDRRYGRVALIGACCFSCVSTWKKRSCTINKSCGRPTTAAVTLRRGGGRAGGFFMSDNNKICILSCPSRSGRSSEIFYCTGYCFSHVLLGSASIHPIMAQGFRRPM